MRVGVTGPYSTLVQGSPQPPCTRYVKVNLLVGQPLYFLVEPKARTKELHAELCGYLRNKGMLDTDLFGLAVLLDGEFIFVDPDYKLSKYAPKSWRSSSSNGLDNCGKPLLEFRFQVQFYVESPLLLQDDLSIEHYYTQIEKNVVDRGLFHPSASHQALFILAGLALQARYGDSYQPEFYVKPQNYLPQQLVTTCGGGRLSHTIASLHRANSGLSKAQARIQYIRDASSLDTSAIPHNTHLYRLRSSKHEPAPGDTVLAICTRGIELYQENSLKPLSCKFLWNDIGKLCFDRKKFEIRRVNAPSNEKYVYYTSSDEKSKHLLTLCKVTHQYSMAIQPRLAQVRGHEESERKQCREWSVEMGKYSTRYGGTGEQRISVISSTSSTTTSGIVSDRVHSLDESEDDLELEIMINSPPAPSTESLALAHLCESTQNSPSPQPSHEIKPDVVDGGPTGTSAPVMTPATTDGSQCSSSASTVVVQKQQNASIEPISNGSMVSRCESVTSSLELGYSHTAQHSALSESCELDYSVQSAHCTASSGVYTLDGGSDNHTAIETLASSSGIGLESQDPRSRSGSLVSNTGSFHGDGSDPSDAGQGKLLSAEELSNLIVHRSPKPRRGVYPTRATVSSTLDSCSDYVTLPPPPLPPPPVPPPRTDSDKSLHPAVAVAATTAPQTNGYLLSSLMTAPSSVPAPPPPPQLYYSHHQNVLPQIVIPQQHYQYIPDMLHPLNSLPSPSSEDRFISSKPSHVIPNCSSYLHSSHSFTQSSSRYDPSARMKVNHSMIPIVGANNYLDVRGSYLQQYHHRPHPPPPPPRPRTNHLATVYTSQVARSQIEQFKQQLYSDADYVMYPLQDPAVSKQEYLESKLALGYRATPPPPYPSKGLIYRSTPNVAIASTSYVSPLYNKQLSPHNRFASNQNLSDLYQPPASFFGGSPLYSAAASYSSSSTHSLRGGFEPTLPGGLHSPQQIFPSHHAPLPHHTLVSSASFHRTLSDDNILNCERVKYRRPPPPVPTSDQPPLLETSTPGLSLTPSKSSPRRESSSPPGNNRKENALPLDISSLREKSRNLDLPLISALCNDRNLLKQTNAFVMPQHPTTSSAPSDRPSSWHVEAQKLAELSDMMVTPKKSLFASLLSSTSSSSKSATMTTPATAAASTATTNGGSPAKSSSSCSSSSKLKYPVSGLSTNEIVKANRKTTSRHKHPTGAKHQAKVSRSHSTGTAAVSKDLAY